MLKLFLQTATSSMSERNNANDTMEITQTLLTKLSVISMLSVKKRGRGIQVKINYRVWRIRIITM